MSACLPWIIAATASTCILYILCKPFIGFLRLYTIWVPGHIWRVGSYFCAKFLMGIYKPTKVLLYIIYHFKMIQILGSSSFHGLDDREESTGRATVRWEPLKMGVTKNGEVSPLHLRVSTKKQERC